MNMGFEIVLTKAEELRFSKYIKEQVLLQMYERIVGAAKQIRTAIKDFVTHAIQNSPEVQELLYGNLRFQLGIYSTEVWEVIDSIIDILTDDTKYFLMAYKQKDYVKVSIGLVESSYNDILSISEGHFTSKGGFVIPWLEWLLIHGHQQVVRNYHVRYVPFYNDRSRSGGAFMLKGGDYSIIPSQFTGTIQDNFITRALVDLDNVMYTELERIIV